MLLDMTVYNDGRYFIGNLPYTQKPRVRSSAPKFSKEKVELFNEFYLEAQQKELPRKKILSYIEERIRETCDIEYWFVENESEELLKRTVNNAHKRVKRYERKVYWNTWSWFVTFTYDSKRETEEGFRMRLRKALSNCAVRHGWRYIGVEERGKKSDRLHFHFIMQIPEGGMIGKLFLDCKYSSKRGKKEFFTNNTYFQDRFGQTAWEVITEEDMKNGTVLHYLLKYLKKTGTRLIYSRGIPSEKKIMVDTERDVICRFRQYTEKVLLKWGIDSFTKKQKERRAGGRFVFGAEEIPAWDDDQLITVP